MFHGTPLMAHQQLLSEHRLPCILYTGLQLKTGLQLVLTSVWMPFALAGLPPGPQDGSAVAVPAELCHQEPLQHGVEGGSLRNISHVARCSDGVRRHPSGSQVSAFSLKLGSSLVQKVWRCGLQRRHPKAQTSATQ